MRSLFIISLMVFWMLVTHIQAQIQTVTYVKDPHANPPDLPVSLRHVEASLEFEPATWRVIGEAVIRFVPLGYQTDSIVFLTPGFNVERIRINRQDVRFRSEGKNTIVYPESGMQKGEEYTLSMVYESDPVATGIYFVGWKPEEEGKRRQIWAHRPFGWLPYMDGRVTMDIRITFDSDYSVFTNGVRVSVKDHGDGTSTWHYRLAQNHPYFSTALGIGDYDFKAEKTRGGVPLELLYYRGMEEKVEPTYQWTREMFDFFEEEMGVPYPYDVYREIPVIDYMYGGMECTTSTIFGDYMLIDPRAYWQRNYINVNAHELAHQWFGDCIDHLAHQDVWLTESFGTYWAKMFERSVFGEEYYENIVRQEQAAALQASKENDYPVCSSRGGRARIYDKGSVVLGMLRDVMGDREFRDAVRSYLLKFGYGSAETRDLFRTVYDVTGRSYDWFFDQWVRRPGEPHYAVSYRVMDDTTGSRSTFIRAEQIHPVNDLTGLFRMPVWLQVWYTDGSADSVQTWIEEQLHEVRIPNPEKKKIDYLLFDPGNRILKQVTFHKSFQELASQALKAPHMTDRFDALVALQPVLLNEKRDLLIQCYGKEKFHLTKSEILRQLSADTLSGTRELFRQAIHDPDAEVRKTVLLVLDPIPVTLKTDVETLLYDSSYLNVELALERLCREFPADAPEYLEKTAGETGWRGKNIRMKWLQLSIENWKLEFLPELISCTAPTQEFETRMNAFNALKQLGYIDETIARNAREASRHWNNKLAMVARDFLSYFYQIDEYKELIDE
ncbi:MAG: M1 family metallopeptidase [Bacteroidales bacterium]|nr:M1 family metallopeptidase [Bacteroidales bacterium]